MAADANDLDRLALGCNAIAWRSWPGLPSVAVGIRGLTRRDRAEAQLEARTDEGALLPRVVRAERERDALRRGLVRRALVSPVLSIDEVGALDRATVRALFALVRDVEDDAHAESLWASGGAADQALGDIDTPMERARARHALALCAYYGVSCSRDLTDWQVLAFTHLTRPMEKS